MPRKVLEDVLKDVSADEKKVFEDVVKLYKPEEHNKYRYEKWNGIIGGTEFIFDEVYQKHLKLAIKDKLHEGKGKEAHAKVLEHLILESLRATRNSEALAVAKIYEEGKKAGKFKESVDEMIQELYRMAENHLGMDEDTKKKLYSALDKSSDPLYKRQVIKETIEKMKDGVINVYKQQKLNKETIGKETKFKAYLVEHNEKKGHVPDSYAKSMLERTEKHLSIASNIFEDDYKEKQRKEILGYKKMTADEYYQDLGKKKAAK